MAPLFSKWANLLAKLLGLIGLSVILGVGVILFLFNQSEYASGVGISPRQPVPFSHRHHVQGAGIDCRYCHSTVETAAFAGLPSTHVCMTCHSQLWAQSPVLKPVRESYEEKIPLQWSRVQRLADFVYFDHSIHIQKGVGCSSCHGRMDQMALAYPIRGFQMKDCLECHRNPEKFLREPEEIFNMTWSSTIDQAERGSRLFKKYQIRSAGLTDCSTCHR